MTPWAMNARTRGPHPKSSLSDALLCYLILLKTGLDLPVLAKVLKLSESRLEGNISRVRSIVNAALKQRWQELIVRPTANLNRPFPEAGLLIDNTTVQCFRPKGRYMEVKHYFDGKNHIYGLKKEVSITAVAPHFYVTSSPHYPGSVHDYTIHKMEYRRHFEYTLKQPSEVYALPADCRHEHWATVLDKAYIGPEGDTPDERRITPTKNPHTAEQVAFNRTVSNVRVPVEQFFGRLYNKFGVLRKIYRYDHAHFDVDFENACLLTNEDILITALCAEDGTFYKQLLTVKLEAHNTIKEKRKREREAYHTRKKSRLDEISPFVR